MKNNIQIDYLGGASPIYDKDKIETLVLNDGQWIEATGEKATGCPHEFHSKNSFSVLICNALLNLKKKDGTVMISIGTNQMLFMFWFKSKFEADAEFNFDFLGNDFDLSDLTEAIKNDDDNSLFVMSTMHS